MVKNTKVPVTSHRKMFVKAISSNGDTAYFGKGALVSLPFSRVLSSVA